MKRYDDLFYSDLLSLGVCIIAGAIIIALGGWS
jgi:hypothetical protein